MTKNVASNYFFFLLPQSNIPLAVMRKVARVLFPGLHHLHPVLL